jgi:hypothetical protein
MKAVRIAGWVLMAGVLVAGCTGDGAAPGSAVASPTGDPQRWRSDPSEPYPFTTPIPPRRPTPVDGTYRRAYERGSEPIPCRRCAPYRLDQGVAVMTLEAGRYHLVHEASDFRASGHYVIDGDRLELFNDPTCSETRGTYRWAVREGDLILEAVEDACAFDLLRARYLSAAPWERAGS